MFTEDEIITGKCCSVSVCVLHVVMFDCCIKTGTSYTRNSIDKDMGAMASVMQCCCFKTISLNILAKISHKALLVIC